MTPSGDHYDREYYEANGQAGDRPALGWFTRLVERYLPGGPVLDVGCGTGHLLRHLAQTDLAHGFELSEYSAATARLTSPTSTVHTQLADLPDGTYASMTAIHVLEHVPDEGLVELFGHLVRASRPGARMLVVVPELEGRGHRLHGTSWVGFSDPTHINLKPRHEWLAFFDSLKIPVVRQGTDGLWDFPYSGWPRPLDAARHGVPMAVQFLAGRLLLPPGTGESFVAVLQLRP